MLGFSLPGLGGGREKDGVSECERVRLGSVAPQSGLRVGVMILTETTGLRRVERATAHSTRNAPRMRRMVGAETVGSPSMATTSNRTASGWRRRRWRYHWAARMRRRCFTGVTEAAAGPKRGVRADRTSTKQRVFPSHATISSSPTGKRTFLAIIAYPAESR